MAYLLQDEFTTDRAAGAVNGTAAEPSGQTRTVTDGNNKLSIASGLLTFATGGVVGGNPGLWYPLVSRVAGRVMAFQVTPASNTADHTAIGWDTAQLGNPADAIRFRSTGNIGVIPDNAATVIVVAYTGGVSYPCAVILRATGAVFLYKVSGNWILLWVSSSGNTDMYPSIVANSALGVFTSDYIRIPTDLWLPTPLASDGFASAFATTDGLGHAEGVAGGIGAGGSGLTWTGATWSVSTAKAVNTPGLGSELAANNDFAVDANWSKGTGWTIAGGVGVKAAGSNAAVFQAIMTVGSWYQMTWDLVTRTAGSFSAMFGTITNIGPTQTVPATYIHTGRGVTGTSGGIRGDATADGTVDNVFIKLLTLADLFSSVSVSTADVVADVNVVVTSGTQAGLVINLDSTGTPANFVIAYHDGTNAKLEKCVAGTYTTVITAAATYSAGATLRVTKIGTAYRLYYNNALVGSGTISDAGIISNTRHGLFSTYSANTLDNFVVYASGSGGEYATLDTLGAGGGVPLFMASYRRRRAA